MLVPGSGSDAVWRQRKSTAVYGVARVKAGHQDLTTTQRYMHLSPAHKDAAIRLLDQRPVGDEGSPKRLRHSRPCLET
jgi:hypothetical protein